MRIVFRKIYSYKNIKKNSGTSFVELIITIFISMLIIIFLVNNFFIINRENLNQEHEINAYQDFLEIRKKILNSYQSHSYFGCNSEKNIKNKIFLNFNLNFSQSFHKKFLENLFHVKVIGDVLIFYYFVPFKIKIDFLINRKIIVLGCHNAEILSLTPKNLIKIKEDNDNEIGEIIKEFYFLGIKNNDFKHPLFFYVKTTQENTTLDVLSSAFKAFSFFRNNKKFFLSFLYYNSNRPLDQHRSWLINLS